MFSKGINTKEFGEKLLNAAMYSGEVTSDDTAIILSLPKDGELDNAD